MKTFDCTGYLNKNQEGEPDCIRKLSLDRIVELSDTQMSVFRDFFIELVSRQISQYSEGVINTAMSLVGLSSNLNERIFLITAFEFSLENGFIRFEISVTSKKFINNTLTPRGIPSEDIFVWFSDIDVESDTVFQKKLELFMEMFKIQMTCYDNDYVVYTNGFCEELDVTEIFLPLAL